MASTIVDTNILVYSHDLRDARKQRIAAELLRRGIAKQSIGIAYQAVVEFYAAVTRRDRNNLPILDAATAALQMEKLLEEFDVLYPNEEVIRAALHATASYQLPWFDALMWAYAATNGMTEILSEDFQHGRLYGTVRVINPFL
ncbi:MAG TPA: PIN domain-containing protein [Thermoanaerobaculia bacterium]|nr:PIN domain-containing protein [Thermoanaerobaculia bacterium]